MMHSSSPFRTVSLLAAVGFALAFAGPVLAQPQVAGKWLLDIDSPQGATTSVLTLAVEGEVVKGSLAGQMGETPITGTAKGAEVTFSFEFAGPSGPISIGAKATVSGDEIKGEMDYGMGVAPFAGKRGTP